MSIYNALMYNDREGQRIHDYYYKTNSSLYENKFRVYCEQMKTSPDSYTISTNML